jgi:hypothetical protein
MTTERKKLLGKLLEALGIAATMIGLLQGIFGDMWGELYFSLAGILVFLTGRQVEKRADKTKAPSSSGAAS